MRDRYDRSSKWLLEHHGASILRLAGLGDLRAARSLQADLVQPRQLPDGLLEVEFGGLRDLRLFLVEIATYAEARLPEQIARDMMPVFLDRRQLADVVTLVLDPRGQAGISGRQSFVSPCGWSELSIQWRMVELWKLPAKDLLAAGDIGLVPWIPLTQFDRPAESVFQECRNRIDNAPVEERANLLAVTQVLAGLRFHDPNLLNILGGRQAMIESPVLQELMAEHGQKYIVRILEKRFGAVPVDIRERLRSVRDDERLDQLVDQAVVCETLDEFRNLLD